MKHWIKLLSFFLLIFLAFPLPILARSGCCSHHEGVCGCRCCDGSALSAKCAPYYPSCNSAPVVQKVYPTSIPTRSNKITYENNINQKSETNEGDGSTANGLLLAGVGYGAYKLIKKSKKDENKKT